MADQKSLQSEPLRIVNLRFAHTSNLLGVDDPTPPISWAYSSPRPSKAWWQQTYILSLRSWNLANLEDASSESIRVIGPRTSRSENIPWPKAFPKVEPARVYELSVTAILSHHKDRNDVYLQLGENWEFGSLEGDTLQSQDAYKLVLSDIAGNSAVDTLMVTSTLRFEGALVGGLDTWRRRAPGILPISTPWDLENWERPKAVSVFQRKFNIDDSSRNSRLYITAFGVYNIYINDKIVNESIMEPGWTEYARRLLYQTYDVTEFLTAGENTIMVWVADGWYRGRLGSGGGRRRGVFGKETGFMAFLEIFKEAGSSQILATGPTDSSKWKCTRTSPIQETEIYDGERFDSRIDLKSLPDESWVDVKVMEGIWSTSQYPILQAASAPPVLCTEILQVKKYIKSPSGKTILDFGQNFAGRIAMECTAPSGTKVSFVHVEVLEPDGTPCTGLLRDAKATDTYVFKGSSTETFEPHFTFHGFRYVQVDPWIEGMKVTGKVYGSKLPTGVLKFNSSHSELNRLVENIQWSARANFLSICTDCPQRDERMGWTGDINAFGPTAVYIFDCQTFLRSWLHGLVDGQKLGPNGSPPQVSPNAMYMPGSHRPAALWQDVLITLPWYLYQAYGDITILSDLYDSMVEYHTRGIPKDRNGELWADGFQYGDWLDPSAPPGRPDQPATSPMFVANTWLCNITNTLVKISTVLQKQDGVQLWWDKAQKLKSRWQEKYILPLTSQTRGLANGEPLKILSQDTQTAYSLALNFGLLPETLVEASIQRLHHLIQKNDYHLATGFAGTPELLHAICAPVPSSSSSQNRAEALALAYKVLLGPRTSPSWLYPITMGATTVWERWDAVKPDGTVNTAGMTSLNHYAYGSVGRWIFENVGGIKMEYQEKLENDCGGWIVVFDPIPNLEFGIINSEMIFESPKGRVECNWEYDSVNKKMTIETALPGNCEGEVRLIGKSPKRVSSGKQVITVALDDEDWGSLQDRYVQETEDWVVV